MKWKTRCRYVKVTHSYGCFCVQRWHWSCSQTDFCMSSFQVPMAHFTLADQPHCNFVAVAEYFPLSSGSLKNAFHSAVLTRNTTTTLKPQTHLILPRNSKAQWPRLTKLERQILGLKLTLLKTASLIAGIRKQPTCTFSQHKANTDTWSYCNIFCERTWPLESLCS